MTHLVNKTAIIWHFSINAAIEHSQHEQASNHNFTKMFVKYFIPEDGDEQAHPNVFRLDSNQPTFSEIKNVRCTKFSNQIQNKFEVVNVEHCLFL